jgi:hypothetical protein
MHALDLLQPVLSSEARKRFRCPAQNKRRPELLFKSHNFFSLFGLTTMRKSIFLVYYT